MQAAAEAAALQRKQVLEAASLRHSNQATIDGRLQLQLIEARLAGNAKEVVQLEARMHLLNQMRQIQAQTGVSQREAYNLSQRMGPGGLHPMGGKGGGNFAMGQMAMQAQDIAVQMQMGAKASTIIAQQGSQMLSVFGAGGAIAGGVLAIGGMFYAMGEAARKAFDEAKQAQKEFETQGREAIANGSVAGLIKFTEVATERVTELQRKVAEAWENRTAGDVMSEWAGGPSFSEKNAANEEALKKSQDLQQKAAEALLTNSEREKDIAILRAEGRDKEADQMERQIELGKEFSRISQLDLSTEMRHRLENNAVDKLYAEQQKDERLEKEKATKKIESAQTKLDDARQKAAEQQLTLDERIAEVREKMAETDAPAKDKEAEIEAQTKKVELQIKLNNLLEEQKRKQHDAVEEAKRLAEAEKRRHETAVKAYEDQKRRQAELSKSRNDSMMSMEVLRLRARGHSGNKAADKIERNARISQYEAELLTKGASPEFAKQQAQERADLEDKIARRESGLPGHIGGVRNKHMMGGGLDEFGKMNQKGWVTPPTMSYQNGKMTLRPGVWGNTYNDGGLSDRGNSKIPGRYMGGDEGSLSDRATRAAGAQDARETKDTSLVSLLQKMLDVQQKGLLG